VIRILRAVESLVLVPFVVLGVLFWGSEFTIVAVFVMPALLALLWDLLTGQLLARRPYLGLYSHAVAAMCGLASLGLAVVTLLHG
jgi:hypothetical protein